MPVSIVRIEHAVQNFDEWKKVFASDPVDRKKMGVRRYRILRPIDDPNYVMIEFDTSKEAENFRSAIQNMWSSEQAQRVMRNPELRIVEVVATEQY